MGWNYSAIIASYASGAVTGTDRYVGGLAGWNDGTVTASYASGTVTGTDRYVGGLVGYNNSYVASSYAMGTVTGDNSVGGLVGVSAGTITSSYSTGDVSGGSDVGGLVGLSFGDITSSYATGTVMGGSNVGGLVGKNVNARSTITSSYATGTVTGDSEVRGLVGFEDGRGTITSSYYSSAAVVLQDGVAVPPDAYARLVVELLSIPTADAPGIFENWAVNAAGKTEDSDSNAYIFGDEEVVWDFGTDRQYPALKVDFDGSGTPTVAEFGTQPRDLLIQVYFAQPEFVVGEEDGEVVVSVVMFNAPDTAVMLTVLVSDGTATSSNDYTYDSSTASLSFDSSDAIDFLTTRTFTITIHTDNELELDETILLSFSTPPAVVVLAAPSTAAVLILDDEARGAYDTDGDGLIEVHTVEQLNVIRYDVNGDGEIDDRTSANPNVPVSKAAAYVRAFGYGLFPPAEVTYRGL